MEECCLIACSVMGSSSATFLVHSRLTSLRKVPPTVGGWSFPQQSPIKKSSSRHGQSDQGNSSVEIRANHDRFYVCVVGFTQYLGFPSHMNTLFFVRGCLLWLHQAPHHSFMGALRVSLVSVQVISNSNSHECTSVLDTR